MTGRRTIAEFRRAAARRLRANETSAEIRLWRALKALPLEGTHFRRQAPIGPFIVDFACLEQRLLVEVDGPSHTTDDASRRDELRTAFLRQFGYRVLRFWNAEVYDNLDGVIETILHHLNAATPPRRPSVVDPPPPGEGV